MRLGLALRAFWKALFDRAAAERLAVALDAAAESSAADSRSLAPPQSAESDKKQSISQQPPAQNPAITLLATLQRDARLIDLIHEDLDQYQDAQVGAAARPCLKQCRQSLARILKIEKLIDAQENDSIAVPEDAPATRFRWIGESGTRNRDTAKLVHPGWQAASVQLPQWNGASEDALIIAPAQVSQA